MCSAPAVEGDHFRFVPGPVFTNVLLVDEINRATPRTQSALLEAMEESQVSIEGETRPLPDPFLVLATQNPIELEGTFALPEAQLDRFLVRLTLGYPSAVDEGRIASRFRATADPLSAVEPIVDGGTLLAMRETVRQINVADEVQEYVVRLVRTTRERKEVRIGGSPRASVALYRAAQSYAYLDGRGFVLPDDVKSVAAAVLNHRVFSTSTIRCAVRTRVRSSPRSSKQWRRLLYPNDRPGRRPRTDHFWRAAARARTDRRWRDRHPDLVPANSVDTFRVAGSDLRAQARCRPSPRGRADSA